MHPLTSAAARMIAQCLMLFIIYSTKTFRAAMFCFVRAIRCPPVFLHSHGFTASGRIAALPFGRLAFISVATIADV